MFSLTRQTKKSTKYWLQMIISSLTMFSFICFAFLIGSIIILSIIPIYIQNKSVEKTRFILTNVRMNNYTLYMNRLLGKRDLIRLINNTEILTLDETRMTMNLSIQYALTQQLKAGDNRDEFNINILKMIPYTDNPTNMSVTLDFLITYTKECISCNKHRQLIIFKQLCSNTPLLNSINFLIQYTNLSYILSEPIIVYSSYIPIENIIINTHIIPTLQSNNLTNTNTSMQMSNKYLANNYTLIVTTSKSNYLATLDEAGTQNSASQNDGPISLIGAITMYSSLSQIIERQTQLTNSSNAFNITINHIILQFWYSNSTIEIIIDFFINFSTNCDYQCINQRSYQLGNLTNIQVHIQPANLTDGQVRILKNGNFILYDYSLTTQVISNFTGTIIRAIPPIFTAVY